MFFTDKDELNIDDIKNYIDQHKSLRQQYKMLQGYYEGKHKVMQDKKLQSNDGDYVIHPYCAYITDMLTGYFMGQPVVYTAIDNKTDEDDKLLEKLQLIFRNNDEQTNNYELAKTASIKGTSCEVLWRDENNSIRFTNLQPEEAFGIYENTLEKKLKFAIRYYESTDGQGKEYTSIEVYDKDYIHYYQEKGKMTYLELEPHYFKDVPFVFYDNNSEQIGDFEKVIPLVNAYDLSQTGTLKDRQDFTDAFLKLVNVSATTRDDIENARRDKLLLLEEDGDADWLVKPVNDSWVENYNNRLNDDIHKFSYTPDMTDDKFSGNSSGVALEFKLLPMETIRNTKERQFKKGLTRRLELICNALSYSEGLYDYHGIGMTFNDTLPQNIKEIAEIVNILSPYLSKETLLSMLPNIESPKEELEKKENEEDYSIDYEQLQSLINQPEEVEEDED